MKFFYSFVVIIVLCLSFKLTYPFQLSVGLLCDNSIHCDNAIAEGQYLQFYVHVARNATDIVSYGSYELSVTPNNDKLVDIKPRKLFLTGDEFLRRNVTFKVKGVVLGRTKLKVTLQNNSSENDTEFSVLSIEYYELRVTLAQSYLQFYFTLFVGMFISINNVNMGCTLNIEVIKKVLRKPIAPAIGFGCQFLFMPIMAMQIGKLLFPNNFAWRLGLFVFGCCPGGALSNFWTLLFEGDLDLSVTMTFLSDCAALAMMPFWLFVFGGELTKNTNLQIPYVNMIVSLLIFTASLGFGLLIQRIKPKLAAKMAPLVRPFSVILIIIVIFGGIYVNSFIFRVFEWSVVVAGLAVAWGGYLFGAVMAMIARLSRPQIIAVSIETAFQNPGVAYVLLHTSLHQPDSDLAALPIVGQLLATGPPLWVIITIVYFVKRRLKKKKEQETDLEKCNKFIEENPTNNN